MSTERLALELAVALAALRALGQDLKKLAVYPLAWWAGYRKARALLLTRAARRPAPCDARLEHSEQPLWNVHDPAKCEDGPCPVHRRTDHPLRSWPQHFRGDAGFTERVCEHGQGHPDPDDRFAPRVHGCDGCCVEAYAARRAFDRAEGEGRVN